MENLARPCSECEVRPARIALTAILGGPNLRIQLDPPEYLCRTCHLALAMEARCRGNRLETAALPLPAGEAAVERLALAAGLDDVLSVVEAEAATPA